MIDKIASDADNLNEMRIALESFGETIPEDAKEIANLYLGNPTGTEVSVESVKDKAKELIKRLIKWLQEMYAKAKDWMRQYNPSILKLKHRLEKAKTAVSEGEFRHGEVKFRSANRLAVDGTLGDGIAFRLNQAVDMINSFYIDSRKDSVATVKKLIAMAEDFITEHPGHSEGLRDDTVEFRKEMIETLKPLANRIENTFKGYRQSNEVVRRLGLPSSFNVKFDDAHMVSSELMPGNYAIFTLMVNHTPIIRFNDEGVTETQAIGRLSDALKYLYPHLAHVADQGKDIRAAEALDKKGAEDVLKEVEKIIQIKESFSKFPAAELIRGVTRMAEKALKSDYYVYEAINISRGLIALINFDSGKVMSYLTSLANAALDYVNASLGQVTEEEDVPNYPALTHKA